MKLAILWGRNDTFDRGRCTFIKGIFLVGNMSKFLVVRWDSHFTKLRKEINNDICC